MTDDVEQRLRSALSARAGQITPDRLRFGVPPTMAVPPRRLRSSLRRLLPVAAGLAITAAVLGFVTLRNGDPVRRPVQPAAPSPTSASPAEPPTGTPTATRPEPSPSSSPRTSPATLAPSAGTPSSTPEGTSPGTSGPAATEDLTGPAAIPGVTGPQATPGE